MKKISLTLFFLMLFMGLAFADRNTTTITGYNDTQELIKTGDWKVYRVTLIAQQNGGSFAIYDATSYPTLANSFGSVSAEGQEATAYNSKVYDFTNKPIEGSTGLYIDVSFANIVLEYE